MTERSTDQNAQRPSETLRGAPLPRYEIVAHVTRELDCETAEEAAALFRRQLLSESDLAGSLLHLAVWRQDPSPAPSPLPPSLRQKLLDFFTTLEHCAGEAEDAFRGRVEAILMAPPVVHADDPIGANPHGDAGR